MSNIFNPSGPHVFSDQFCIKDHDGVDLGLKPGLAKAVTFQGRQALYLLELHTALQLLETFSSCP